MLKRCLRRQILPEGGLLDLTPFGRALCVGYRNPKHAQGYVLYWVKLPSYQWQHDFIYDQYGWHQLVLFWHGLTGFELRWCRKYE